MADRDDRGAACLRILNHLYHDRAVFGIKGSGRFVQQQDRMLGDETARQVDTLLLTARERRRRDRVQPRRNVQSQQQRPGLIPAASWSMPRARSTSATTSSAETRGTTRRNWLT